MNLGLVNDSGVTHWWGMIPKEDALVFVSKLREIQDLKHGTDHRHTLPEWVIITEKQLGQVKDLWYAGHKTDALQKMGHVAACGVACLEHNSDPR